MLWLEMSRDYTHGGGGWGFTRSLWSPTRKRNNDGSLGGKWTFWENIMRIQADDVVLHLRQEKNGKSAFVGFSTAETDGFRTSECPPVPGLWGYDDVFYRVLLKDFVAFPSSFDLRSVFAQQNIALREYFEKNKRKRGDQKRSIFYVEQAGRLQCLNGAYLSEVDDELAGILFGSAYSDNFSEISSTEISSTLVDVKTGERLRVLRTRVGQKEFSDRIKQNYRYHCCFPGCDVAENRFLIGSHIARWADVRELQGNLSNGLCLCLMHDKAFEDGGFTLDMKHCVRVNRALHSSWCQSNLLPYEGQSIRCGTVLPSLEALQQHWKRINFRP